MTTPAAPKLDSLEAVRGLAAFTVAVAHLRVTFAPDLAAVDSVWTYATLGFSRSARFLVQLFFVQSGFVVARSFLVTGRPEVLASAAVRRYPRLMLPGLAAMLLGYAAWAGGWLHNREAAARVAADAGLAQPPWVANMYVGEPTLGHAIREATWGVFFAPELQHSNNVAVWTLGPELIGSCVVFACLGVFGRGRPLVVGSVVVAALFFLHGRSNVVLFVAGMLLSELFRHTGRWLPAVVAVPVAGLVLLNRGYDLPAVWRLPLGGAYYTGQQLVCECSAVVLFAAVVFCPFFDRVLRVRPLYFLGKISFGIYLVHVPLLASASCRLYLALRDAGWSYPQTVVAVVLSYVPMILIGGYLLYRLADRPALWVSRVLYDRAFRPRPAAVGVPRKSLLASVLGRAREQEGPP